MISPGGSNWNDENDDLRIDFTNEVKEVGLDFLNQSPDGWSFTRVYFYASDGSLLASTGEHIPSPNGEPGYQFVGFIVEESGPLLSYLIIDVNFCIDSAIHVNCQVILYPYTGVISNLLKR